MYRQRDKGGPRHKGIHSIRYMKLYKWEWFLLKLSAKCYVPFFCNFVDLLIRAHGKPLCVLQATPCTVWSI
jgi:hypothetical protein